VAPVVDATPTAALDLQQEVLVCDDLHQTDVSDSAWVTQSKAVVRALRRRGPGAARRMHSPLSERLSAEITTPAAGRVADPVASAAGGSWDPPHPNTRRGR
jgi:hypothetical protein